MATVKTKVLPSGWKRFSGGPVFDDVMVGKPGQRVIVSQNPYAVWKFTASYVRGQLGEAKWEEVYRFFLAMKRKYCFMVDDRFDNTATAQGGTGVVLQLGSDYRLFKRYAFDGEDYDHPITRPNGEITLGGGAEGGTVDPATGIVTGEGIGEGTWDGAFYRPMIFLESQLSFDRDPGQAIKAMNIPLEEQLEVAF